MNTSAHLPSIEAAKAQANRLRDRLESAGTPVGHSRSLELVAHLHGFRDWNTLHAAIGNRPPPSPVLPGQRVRGHYLGQPFEGEVTGVQDLGSNNRVRITCVFDEPVDVVTFESFSNLRRRVTCVIGRDGATVEKTSDGRPHMSLEL